MLVTNCQTHPISYVSTTAIETVAREKKQGKSKKADKTDEPLESCFLQDL